MIPGKSSSVHFSCKSNIKVILIIVIEICDIIGRVILRNPTTYFSFIAVSLVFHIFCINTAHSSSSSSSVLCPLTKMTSRHYNVKVLGSVKNFSE